MFFYFRFWIFTSILPSEQTIFAIWFPSISTEQLKSQENINRKSYLNLEWKLSVTNAFLLSIPKWYLTISQNWRRICEQIHKVRCLIYEPNNCMFFWTDNWTLHGSKKVFIIIWNNRQRSVCYFVMFFFSFCSFLVISFFFLCHRSFVLVVHVLSLMCTRLVRTSDHYRTRKKTIYFLEIVHLESCNNFELCVA